MIKVELKCPVCCFLDEVNFKDTEMEDPAFAEIVVEQPWKIVCDECENTIRDDFSNHECFCDFLSHCMAETDSAVKHAREMVFRG